MVNGNISDNSSLTNSRTTIMYVPSKMVERLLIANNTSEGERENLNFNFNYRFADTSGHELNVDADYGYFNNNNNQIQPNDVINAWVESVFGMVVNTS